MLSMLEISPAKPLFFLFCVNNSPKAFQLIIHLMSVGVMTERSNLRYRVKLVKALYCVACNKLYAYRRDREFVKFVEGV